jgi:predicted DNA-binding protein
MSMRRKQLYIDEQTERALKRVAARTGRSEASIVREALRSFVETETTKHTGDPLERLIGLVDDPTGPDDVAENHDHYLYGAPKQRP